ncbi:MAG: hypothetical protein ACLTD2_07990 [Ruminococcus sp.]
MKGGEIIDSGAPHILCEKIDGKVFEITADERCWTKFPQNTRWKYLKGRENTTSVLSANSRQLTNAKPASPDLEDLYLYYFDWGAS